MASLWKKRRKYVWTREKDNYLRERYDGKVQGRAAQIARSLGWPKWAIKRRAAELGLCYPVDRREYTPEEEVFLEEHAGLLTTHRMAKRLGRTHTSVVLKLKRMKISRRFRDGFTVADIAAAFGVDHHQVDRWIRNGWLRARKRGTRRKLDAHRITENDVVRFVRERPLEFRLDKVDQLFFMDLVIGGGLLRPSDSPRSSNAFIDTRKQMAAVATGG